jgi:lysozyme
MPVLAPGSASTLPDGFLINESGFALVKEFEGCQLRAYQDSVGVWTIGWGRIVYDDGSKVKQGDSCDQAAADKWLKTDLEREGAKYVRAFVKDWKLLNQDQFSALVSFTYNRGAGRFHEKLADLLESDLYDHLIDHAEALKASELMLTYDWAGSKQPVHLAGLLRRRWAESFLFQGRDWTVFKGADWRKFAIV